MEALVLEICRAVRDAGGRAMLVGGSVRDLLLELNSKDIDLEVYAMTPARLREVLERIAPVNTVGEQFSVYKLCLPQGEARQYSTPDGTSGTGDSESAAPRRSADSTFYDGTAQPGLPSLREIDVSIPRRESKSGRGHRGFLITGDPAMTFEEAARRRDFTVNAILLDPLTDETIDPTGGVSDLKRRVLRAVAAETFVEDSLRVLRAMQLAARFEMSIEAATVELCQSIDLSDLPHERVWGEFEKLLMGARKPSIGLQAALDLLILDKLFPTISALARCPINSPTGLERDVFTHTKLALDAAAVLSESLPKARKLTVLLAVLLHDLGRPSMSAQAQSEVASSGHSPDDSSPGHAVPDKHAQAGVEPAREVLDKLGLFTLDGYDVESQVLALVREHQRPRRFYNHRASTTEGDFRRLSRRVDIGLLYLIAKADESARGPGSSGSAAEWFIERAREIGVEHGPPPPLLQGRHLIEAGYDPGPVMGTILRDVYELQLDGKVKTLEEAMAAANSSQSP